MPSSSCSFRYELVNESARDVLGSMTGWPNHTSYRDYLQITHRIGIIKKAPCTRVFYGGFKWNYPRAQHALHLASTLTCARQATTVELKNLNCSNPRLTWLCTALSNW